MPGLGQEAGVPGAPLTPVVPAAPAPITPVPVAPVAGAGDPPHDLSLTLANLCRVGQRVFDALPNMAGNFYNVPAWPGHARNLMVPDFTADGRNCIAEGQS
jgi:hypothetical protein